MSQVKKTTAKPTAKSKAKTPIKRHSDEIRQRILTFIKTGKTNQEAKAKFGVSAHFVGKLRKENGIGSAAKASKPAVSTKPSPKPAPAKGKPAPKAKPSPKSAANADAADLL
jgi:transposase-like protein